MKMLSARNTFKTRPHLFDHCYFCGFCPQESHKFCVGGEGGGGGERENLR